MEDNKESLLTGYPNAISYESTKKILEQMEKGICKIKLGQEQGTGFFCKIPFPNKNNMLPVFITNNHIINEIVLYKEDSKIEIDIMEENNIKIINLNNRLKYTNEKCDITIIEIKEEDNINNYLELDDYIINDIINNNNRNQKYIDETIYVIQYPKGQLYVSYGVLTQIDKNKRHNFYHRCCTERGASGSPIMNIFNKIIGIHKEGGKQYNKGLFLNYPIKEFIQLYNSEKLLQEFKRKYD